ncbi:MAG: hypothetical protein AAB504_01010, partial [Patescibacteria group bacterium]
PPFLDIYNEGGMNRMCRVGRCKIFYRFLCVNFNINKDSVRDASIVVKIIMGRLFIPIPYITKSISPVKSKEFHSKEISSVDLVVHDLIT